jgi:glycosyltransferase involved in cell wall biosynthesis
MSDITISVVIPSYNRMHQLERAIDSVLAQSHPADDIIIVDDGSTDNTQQLLQSKYSQIRTIHQSNKGVSSARNTGIKHAKSTWIALLDSDDSWQPEKLAQQAEALKANKDYLICHTNEAWFRDGKFLNQGKKHEKRGGRLFQHCLPLCTISPSSVIINKQIFDKIGLFDENLPACEDYDMWLRICCRYPVLYLASPLTNKYGGHEDQLSRKHWGMDRFRIIALQKIIESCHLNETDRQAAINTLLKKITLFLKGAKRHDNNEYCEKFETLTKQYS